MATEFTCQRCTQILRFGSQRHVPNRRLTALCKARFVSQSSRSNNDHGRLVHSQARGSQYPGLQTKRTVSFSPSSVAQSAVEADKAAKSAESPPPPGPEYGRALLQRGNLYHPFSRSPSEDIRRRAAFIKQNAYCPHPSHQQTRIPSSPNDSESRKSPDAASQVPPAHAGFECPDCGIPIYCSEDHWMDDFEAHLEVCETIRQINEDDHDLRSGRFFREFEYPGVQEDDHPVNMTNWDTYMYTRQFNALSDDRHMRQVTRLLTYPVTIASILHEFSPYSVRKGGRLTTEGLKSMSG